MINGVGIPIVGFYDFFMMYINNNGVYQTHSVVGGSGWDYARSIAQTQDGDYILGGYTNSLNGMFSSNSGSFDLGMVKISGNILPVEITFLEATPYNTDVTINWQTAVEINNAFFVVERSRDGDSFDGLGLVEGNGTSFEAHDYQFKDYNVAEGKWFYRLRQVDQEGKDRYSEIREVTIAHKRITSVYPNPAINDVTIAGESTIKYATISDFSGQMHQHTYFGNFNETETLDVSNLPKGTYILMVVYEDGTSTYTRLIKE